MALGISGAPQHPQGIGRVDHIIAVNTDLHADAQAVSAALLELLEQRAKLAPGMRIVVLLSSGRHPVSFRPAPVEAELQAIGLARRLARPLVRLHAGPETDLLTEYGGYGLDFIHRLDAAPEPNALLPILRPLEPDIVLAGRRGMGSTDSGMLPYRLAHALGWPIVADITTLEASAAGFSFAQFRPHGARRHLTRRGPMPATVHPAAPPSPAFVFARSRAMSVNTVPSEEAARRPTQPAPEQRTYRRRPRVIAPGHAPAR